MIEKKLRRVRAVEFEREREKRERAIGENGECVCV